MNDYFFDDNVYDDFEEEDISCDYGAEFCEEYFTKEMGLCTTECRLYFDMVREHNKYWLASQHWYIRLSNKINSFIRLIKYKLKGGESEI